MCSCNKLKCLVFYSGLPRYFCAVARLLSPEELQWHAVHCLAQHMSPCTVLFACCLITETGQAAVKPRESDYAYQCMSSGIFVRFGSQWKLLGHIHPVQTWFQHSNACAAAGSNRLRISTLPLVEKPFSNTFDPKWSAIQVWIEVI